MPLQCNAPPAHGGEDAVSTCDLDPMLSWFIEHGCEAFEVLADTGLLDVALRTSGHFAPQNHLGLSQSNDVTRIFRHPRVAASTWRSQSSPIFQVRFPRSLLRIPLSGAGEKRLTSTLHCDAPTIYGADCRIPASDYFEFRLLAFVFERRGDVFEVLAGAGLLEKALRLPATSPLKISLGFPKAMM